MKVGDKVKVKAIEGWNFHQLEIGDTGTYSSGSEYVPGLDASQYVVTLDNPRGKWSAIPYWTYDEMCKTWEKV